MAGLPWFIGAYAAALVVIAGFDAPLAVLALALLALSGVLPLNGAVWGMPAAVVAAGFGLLAVLQAFLNVYFVPISVRDRQYVSARRTEFSYLHTRFQSLFRPLVSALVVGALPMAAQVQVVAFVGFVMATVLYWYGAWVRERIAMTRGTLVLVAGEMVKQGFLAFVVTLLFWSPLLAVACLLATLMPTTWWVLRLQRESRPIPMIGILSVADDTKSL
ncbi:MAG: hypothetical protein NVS2B7_38670 [Herpetosiphon sp.]